MRLTSNTLRFKCPNCGTRFKSSPLYREAIDVIRRTCAKCKKRYVIKITPHKLKNDIGYAHFGDITELL